MIFFSLFSQSVDDKESIKRKEVIGNRIDGAIVESIPGSALSAEDADPQTRCGFQTNILCISVESLWSHCAFIQVPFGNIPLIGDFSGPYYNVFDLFFAILRETLYGRTALHMHFE